MCRTRRPKDIILLGHVFKFLQLIRPECDEQGRIWRFHPQKDYRNRKGLPLSKYGRGAFCRFSIEPHDQPGVYILVVSGEVIYIGETRNLSQRFNMGYGCISPRGCFSGGQSTNCKINKAILRLSVMGKDIALYFLRTSRHKQIERELLAVMKPRLNKKL